MTTPVYRGTSQPIVSNGGGWLGRLGSLFGAGTPQYLGEGQPSPNSGLLGNVMPAYKPAPVVQASKENQVDEAHAVDACASCPVDPDALAAGNIAIVIPRLRCDRDEVAATD